MAVSPDTPVSPCQVTGPIADTIIEAKAQVALQAAVAAALPLGHTTRLMGITMGASAIGKVSCIVSAMFEVSTGHAPGALPAQVAAGCISATVVCISCSKTCCIFRCCNQQVLIIHVHCSSRAYWHFRCKNTLGAFCPFVQELQDILRAAVPEAVAALLPPASQGHVSVAAVCAAPKRYPYANVRTAARRVKVMMSCNVRLLTFVFTHFVMLRPAS
jgi:hypothetical protein